MDSTATPRRATMKGRALPLIHNDHASVGQDDQLANAPKRGFLLFT